MGKGTIAIHKCPWWMQGYSYRKRDYCICTMHLFVSHLW